MTRPTILDLDLVVVPREATLPIVSAYSEKQDEYGISHFANARVVYPAMLSASPYPTAWDDVRKYVEGLEGQVAFTMTDTSRMLRKSDIKDVCPHPDDCFYEAERVRCGPCAVKASKLAGIEIDDTNSHLPEVCRLRREVKAAEACIAELEAALDEKEVAAGLTDNGNLWRFWAMKASAVAVRNVELEKRLSDAERVIEPFAAVEPMNIWHETEEDDGYHSLTENQFRAARAYMEGK